MRAYVILTGERRTELSIKIKRKLWIILKLMRSQLDLAPMRRRKIQLVVVSALMILYKYSIFLKKMGFALMVEKDDPKLEATQTEDPTLAEFVLPQAEVDAHPHPNLQKLVQIFKDFSQNVAEKDVEAAMKKMEAFVQNQTTWAKVQDIPQQLLYDLAEFAYLQFQSNRFEEAEKIFRGLSLIDHQNAYYHVALGAVYQKQNQQTNALTEYTVALSLNPNDMVALTNRGEIYFALGVHQNALADLNLAIAQDPTGKDPWANRAKFLRKQVLEEVRKFSELDQAQEKGE